MGDTALFAILDGASAKLNPVMTVAANIPIIVA
jgi:hypothetical protein